MSKKSTKQQQSERILADTEKYLRGGGQIDRLPDNCSAIDTKPKAGKRAHIDERRRRDWNATNDKKSAVIQ